ncbi:MAG TPA: type II secretion system F family protein [Candidatus Saccharimonadales bacterium]|nr:type II secretion system F family protein [Candidatus Saccharimonadales bacterium]
MLTYKYIAKNGKTGETVKSSLQAETEQAAATAIRGLGLTPLSIEAQVEGGTFKFNRIKTKDKVLFSRQLSTLIDAGLPLVQSLRNVAQQTTNKPLRVVINKIITDVEGGKSFSDALSQHPKVFNPVFINLVAASETSGTLDDGLMRLADQQEKDSDIISKVRGALIYPVIVLVVMLAVVLFMIIKVLPAVQSIYAGLKGVKLPLITQILLDISHFVTHFWWLVLLIVGATVIFGVRWSKTISGQSAIDRLKMTMWPIGPLYMKMYMARFSRTGATLVAAGVPLIQMLNITSEAIDNVHIAGSLRGATEKVKGGKALSESIANDPNFLELVPNMLHIGEQSGSTEAMLTKVADYYEKEVDNQIKAISTVIEPVMMVLMGIIAIIIVAAILLPIYGLVNQSGFTNSI